MDAINATSQPTTALNVQTNMVRLNAEDEISSHLIEGLLLT